MASILGNGKLRNYSHYTNTYNICLIHTWSSVIEINNKKNMAIEIHKKIANTTTRYDRKLFIRLATEEEIFNCLGIDLHKATY